MGSNFNNYFGGNTTSGSSSSSSSSRNKSGKKSKSGTDDSNNKPRKQPQRGLGVAQLEQIRLMEYNQRSNPNSHSSTFGAQGDINKLQTAYSSSSSSFAFSSSPSRRGLMMGFSDSDRAANIRFGVSQPSSVARWLPEHAGLGTQSITTPFFEPRSHDQGSINRINNINDESTSQIDPESSGSQEIDLELRLSR